MSGFEREPISNSRPIDSRQFISTGPMEGPWCFPNSVTETAKAFKEKLLEEQRQREEERKKYRYSWEQPHKKP